MPESSHADEMEPRTLAMQFGCRVTQLEPEVVLKNGSKVRPSEAEAMRLVREQRPSVPVPDLYHSWFGLSRSVQIGQLYMKLVPGTSLDSVWGSFPDSTKERICRAIWGFVAEIRTIPRPAHVEASYCCAADGSPSRDPLLGCGDDPATLLPDDAAVRERIFARYVLNNGLSYADGETLPDRFPRSSESVFTHGDIAPRNVMVDENGQILALLDWENAGWYPDYWEYANIMRPFTDHDWTDWMERTAPRAWDITGLNKARRHIVYPMSSSPEAKRWRVLNREYSEADGRVYSRKLDPKTGIASEWKEHEATTEDGGPSPSAEEPKKLYLVLHSQSEGEPMHWALFVCDGDTVASKGTSSIEEAVGREEPPRAEDQRSVKENCQGWTIRVLRRIEGEVVKRETVDWIENDLKEPINR
ncbi:hypothetical protein ACJZ2D_013454 [Fusarium nematophilum]